ncbi:hypothetical protein D3877_10425 [Azospirillum cavernae]|uniref:Uncharacterized protein n=1 Tax=Azospirillum cavernae TaxID=2320860 RepID=A0A418W4D6_9PROT|nr:hypothetical protein D3877_10425 [Azospirillum cavernae]
MPGWLAALNLSPGELTDLTDRGYPETGYVHVVEGPPPEPPPGHVVERDGWTVGATTASPHWSARPITDAERSVMVAERIALVKAEAERRILKIAPLWRQANLTARAAELMLLYGVRGDDLPEPLRSEYREGQAVWDRIKAVRAASGVIEEAVAMAADPTTVDLSVGWP